MKVTSATNAKYGFGLLAGTAPREDAPWSCFGSPGDLVAALSIGPTRVAPRL